MVLGMFFLFILCIFDIVLLSGSIVLSTVCTTLNEVLTSNDMNVLLKSYNIELDKMITDMANNCIPTNADGDLSKILNVDISASFDNIRVFLDGVK